MESASSETPAGEPEYPRVFGKYVLLRSLAKGGMGELFVAAAGETGGFEKLCVVKKVLNTLEDDAFKVFGEAAVFAARETESGIRRLHFFCWNVPGLDELAADWSEGITVRKVESEVSVDPDWSISSRWA